MNYAKIENDQIVKIGPRPRWFNDGGEPLTAEQWLSFGYYPITYQTPEYDPYLHRVVLKPHSEWTIESDRVVATYDVVDIDIEELRQAKLEAATDMRWQVMTGGMTLPNGVAVGTTIDDQNRITSVVANAELAGLTDADEVDFKAASGWVRITIAQVKQIAGAIGQHVQACYSAERAHHEAIEALETREEVAAYDVGVGWPETDPETATT